MTRACWAPLAMRPWLISTAPLISIDRALQPSISRAHPPRATVGGAMAPRKRARAQPPEWLRQQAAPGGVPPRFKDWVIEKACSLAELLLVFPTDRATAGVVDPSIHASLKSAAHPALQVRMDHDRPTGAFLARVVQARRLLAAKPQTRFCASVEYNQNIKAFVYRGRAPCASGTGL